MSRDECVKQVLETGIVAIVRSHDSQQLVEVASSALLHLLDRLALLSWLPGSLELEL